MHGVPRPSRKALSASLRTGLTPHALARMKALVVLLLLEPTWLCLAMQVKALSVVASSCHLCLWDSAAHRLMAMVALLPCRCPTPAARPPHQAKPVTPTLTLQYRQSALPTPLAPRLTTSRHALLLAGLPSWLLLPSRVPLRPLVVTRMTMQWTWTPRVPPACLVPLLVLLLHLLLGYLGPLCLVQVHRLLLLAALALSLPLLAARRQPAYLRCRCLVPARPLVAPCLLGALPRAPAAPLAALP